MGLLPGHGAEPDRGVRHGRRLPAALPLAGVSESVLRKRCRIGYRARYLAGIAERWLSAPDPDSLAFGRLPGLGPYGSAHVRVLAGDYSQIAADSVGEFGAESRLAPMEAGERAAKNQQHRRYADQDQVPHEIRSLCGLGGRIGGGLAGGAGADEYGVGSGLGSRTAKPTSGALLSSVNCWMAWAWVCSG